MVQPENKETIMGLKANVILSIGNKSASINSCRFSMTGLENLLSGLTGLQEIEELYIKDCKIDFDKEIELSIVNDFLDMLDRHFPNATKAVDSNNFVSIAKQRTEKKEPNNWDKGLDLLRNLW